MQLILLEGPDGGGKTHTALNALASLGYAYQHNGPPPACEGHPDTWDARDIFTWQLKNLKPKTLKRKGWLVDRSWPSEQIYHRFAGRPHTFDAIAHRMFERYMLSHQGVVVMCLPPYEVAYTNWQKRVKEGKELLTQDAQFAEMYEFYRAWPIRTCLPVVTYDYTLERWSPLADSLKSINKSVAVSINPAPGVLYGDPGAAILVIGSAPTPGFIGTDQVSRAVTHTFMRLGLRECDTKWVDPSLANEGQRQAILRDRRTKIIIALGVGSFVWATHDVPTSAPVHLVANPAFQGDAWAIHANATQYQRIAQERYSSDAP